MTFDISVYNGSKNVAFGEGFIPKFAYECEIVVKTISGEYTSKDVNNFFVFRAPFTKTGNFATLTAIFDVDVYSFIDDDIRKNKFPILNIKINLAENDFSLKKGPRTFSTRAGGIQNQYRILHVQARENADVGNNSIPITFYLMNRILYELSQSKSYNKIFENTTASNVLDDYETHINSKFGGNNLFKFKKFTSDENKFKFKQSLIKTENDLLVPSWIVNNMKPSNGLTYYFFDDFIPLKDYGLVNGLMITLSKDNIKKFELIDISEPEYQDVELRLQLIKTESMSDVSGLFNIENATLNISTPRQKLTVRKGKSTKVQSASQSSGVDDEIMYGRPVENRAYNDKESSSTINSTGISIYACDSIDNAEKRFNNVGNLIKNDIEYIATYETKEIHFDIIQFFRAYNLAPEIKDYIYVPISIANIFSKYSKRETTLCHGAKFQFLVYKV